MSFPTVTPAETRLFKPLKAGNANLQHRIVMAPLTRMRNDDNHVPLSFMEKYYADRASAPGTLIISEATAISHFEEGYLNGPSIVNDEQVAGWTKIIEAVHAKGSFFFQQIWGMGRASQPEYMQKRGFPYRSASNVPMEGSEVAPTAMTEAEILQTIQDFADTAKRVVAAGGDGVEIHSAHGYLLDQFLTSSINKRTDRWGGSVENRARLTLEVVKAVTAAIGAEKVAIRFSPYASFQGSEKDDSRELFDYLIAELKKMNAKFAYLSLVEAVGDPVVLFNPEKAKAGEERTLDFILEAWDNQSPVLVAGNYKPQTAALAVENRYKNWDVLVGFGRSFISNPDLVFRIKNEIGLTNYDRSTFYKNKSEDGYNDYPFSEEYLKAYSDAQALLLAAVKDEPTVAVAGTGAGEELVNTGVTVEA